MSLPQAAARRGFRTVRCLLACSILLAALLPQAAAGNLPLTCNPASLQFGAVQMGGRQTLTAVMTNRGWDATTISSQTTAGPDFSLGGIAFPLTLAAGQSFTFSVTFTPQSTGAISGSLNLLGVGGSALNIPLAGTGTPAGELVSYPARVNFGKVPVGKTSRKRGILTATGASVTIYSARSSNSEFAASGLSFPFTIAPGQLVPYRMTFHPQIGGKASGILSFRSNATDYRTTQDLSGDGRAPETYTVYLSWQASKSQVVGYNVYRGIQSGGPYSMINSGLDPGTSYTDNGVVSGETYYYVTTAVNSGGQESTYSNQAEANIP